MATSPAHYRYQLGLEPKPPTAEQALGIAIHALVLEGHGAFADRVAEQPNFGDMRTKAARAARDEWLASVGDRLVLSADAYRTAQDCAAAVLSHDVAKSLLDGCETERVLQWQIGDTHCKGRVDAIARDRIIDLKTTRRQRPDQFARDAAEYLYHGQLAWYYDAAQQLGLLAEPAVPWIVTVCTTPPHDVICYDCGGDTLERGQMLWTRLLADYQSCTILDSWPGAAPGPLELVLPRWAL
jgi:exodeoxyribonuclease VIII